MCSKHVVKLFEPLEVDVKYSDIGSHANGDLAGVHAYRAAAEDDHVRLGGSGNAGKKYALTAVLALKILRAFLDGETAGDLAHG